MGKRCDDVLVWRGQKDRFRVFPTSMRGGPYAWFLWRETGASYRMTRWYTFRKGDLMNGEQQVANSGISKRGQGPAPGSQGSRGRLLCSRLPMNGRSCLSGLLEKSQTIGSHKRRDHIAQLSVFSLFILQW